MDPVLIVAAVVGGVLVLALLGATVQERRTKQLQQWANEMGWAFRSNDPALASLLQGVRMFAGTAAEFARNVLHGSAQHLDTVICDYHHHTGTGKNAVFYRVTVLIFQHPDENWPVFVLRPRRFSDRLLGISEITFDDPAFSKSYVLLALDELAVRALFTDDVRHFFAEHPGLWVDGEETRLVFSRGKLIASENLESFLGDGFRVLNTLQTGGADKR